LARGRRIPPAFKLARLGHGCSAMRRFGIFEFIDWGSALGPSCTAAQPVPGDGPSATDRFPGPAAAGREEDWRGTRLGSKTRPRVLFVRLTHRRPGARAFEEREVCGAPAPGQLPSATRSGLDGGSTFPARPNPFPLEVGGSHTKAPTSSTPRARRRVAWRPTAPLRARWRGVWPGPAARGFCGENAAPNRFGLGPIWSGPRGRFHAFPPSPRKRGLPAGFDGPARSLSRS